MVQSPQIERSQGVRKATVPCGPLFVLSYTNKASRVSDIEKRLRRAQESLATITAKRSEDAAFQESLKAMVEHQCKLQAKLTEELAEARADAAVSKERLNQKEQERAEAEARYVSRLERRVTELTALWGIRFATVDFRQQPSRWAAEQDFGGRLEIERALKELVDAPDPVKLSRSRMHVTHEHHSRFTIPKGVECRMFTLQAKEESRSAACARKRIARPTNVPDVAVVVHKL